jgi:hypothetical protein
MFSLRLPLLPIGNFTNLAIEKFSYADFVYKLISLIAIF